MKRTPMPRRSHPMPRGTPLRSKPRKASEFARVYGSKKRVAWIKSLRCLAWPWGCAGEIVNAHTVSGGTGRKADCTTIVPFCDAHHRRYDEHQPPFDGAEVRSAITQHAGILAAAWDRYEAGLTPLSAIVPGVLENVRAGGGDA